MARAHSITFASIQNFAKLNSDIECIEGTLVRASRVLMQASKFEARM